MIITRKHIPTITGGGKIFFFKLSAWENIFRKHKNAHTIIICILYFNLELYRDLTLTQGKRGRERGRLPSHHCLWGWLEFILHSEICQLAVSPWATESTGVYELLCVKAAGWKYFAWSPYLGVCHIPRTSYNFTHDWRKRVEPRKCKQLHNGCICFNF